MQIFRPDPSHRRSARYLCDLRLNKQVLECYQVAKCILIHMGLAEGRGGYFRHPITQAIWNDGTPYLPDLYVYMYACDKEWIRRGKRRNAFFTEQMAEVKRTIQQNRRRFVWAQMPPCFVSGDIRETDAERIYPLYRELLAAKWNNDRRPARASLRVRRG